MDGQIATSTNTQTDRQADGQKYSQTARQPDRQKDRKTDRQTHTHWFVLHASALGPRPTVACKPL
eukprot:5042097-Prorocentrum_lima.AAC.1